MDVVLDTNILVSAVISPKGAPAEILRAWRGRRFSLVTSPHLLAELERALRYPRVNRYLDWSSERAREFTVRLGQEARLVTPAAALDAVPTDPDDNRVLEVAAATGAEYVVTGDNDLLALGNYGGTRIVTAARFVAILGHT